MSKKLTGMLGCIKTLIELFKLVFWIINFRTFIKAMGNPLTNNTKTPDNWSKSEAATLLYMMDHICSPQDSLKASFDVLDNKDSFGEYAYHHELSDSIVKDDESVKEFEKVIPFLKKVIAQFLNLMNANDRMN
jgi:hypothetical protein